MFNGLLDVETIEVLIYLSPGVVGVGVLYSLLPQLNKGAVTVAFQTLVLALLANFTVEILPHSWYFPEIVFDANRTEPDLEDLALRGIVTWGFAAVLAGIVVVIIRFDLLHWPLRKLNLTDEKPASPRPWDAAYRRQHGYVTVRFKDINRTIIGFPEHWDNDPENGWVKLTDVEWVGGRPDYIGELELEYLLIRVADLQSPITFVQAREKQDTEG